MARYMLAGLLPAFMLAIVTLWRFPPDLYSFYPACPIPTYLHMECPGCGSTRALAALLHGRFAEAVQWNALFVVLVFPLSVSYTAVAGMRWVRDRTFRWPVIPQSAIWGALACVAAFTVLRNL